MYYLFSTFVLVLRERERGKMMYENHNYSTVPDRKELYTCISTRYFVLTVNSLLKETIHSDIINKCLLLFKFCFRLLYWYPNTRLRFSSLLSPLLPLELLHGLLYLMSTSKCFFIGNMKHLEEESQILDVVSVVIVVNSKPKHSVRYGVNVSNLTCCSSTGH